MLKIGTMESASNLKSSNSEASPAAVLDAPQYDSYDPKFPGTDEVGFEVRDDIPQAEQRATYVGITAYNRAINELRAARRDELSNANERGFFSRVGDFCRDAIARHTSDRRIAEKYSERALIAEGLSQEAGRHIHLSGAHRAIAPKRAPFELSKLNSVGRHSRPEIKPGRHRAPSKAMVAARAGLTAVHSAVKWAVTPARKTNDLAAPLAELFGPSPADTGEHKLA